MRYYWYYKESLHKVRPSTTLYYKACTKHVPLLLCTTKLAQITKQYFFLLQGLHKWLPSTALYYKACTKYFRVLLCTAKLAQSKSHYCTKCFPVPLCTAKLAQGTSQYFFVLQSLHKARPSASLYYKACTRHVPVLLCTTKLAQGTSQYFFVLQSLHKARPITTLYYKACTKQVPLLHKVLPSTTSMQPLQCDLQPRIPKHPSTMHTQRTKHCKTPSRNQSHTKTNGPHLRRTRGTFHRRPKPLYTEKRKVSCSGFIPTLHECIGMWCKVKSHAALHVNVLVCDVK